jgi:hypothetical protein
VSYGHHGATGDIRVYRYHVSSAALHQAGAENLDLAVDQMRRRVALWNRLVEIARAIEAEQQPVIDACRDDTGRARLTPEARERLREIEEAHRDTVNAACRESGCYWHNYAEVKIAWQAARRRPGDLRFHAWRGEGRVALYLSPGLPVAAACAGTDSRLQVVPRPGGKKPGDVLVRLRIGSTGPRREPVWCTLPVYLHRPLPEDGVIRVVAIQRELLGDDPRWTVVFTIERAPGAWRTHAGERTGRIAIDIGWRRLADGTVRVARWRDSGGCSGDVTVPGGVFAAFEKCDDLASIRALMFNRVREQLAAWLATRELPAWLREETAHIAQWRSPARVVRLWRRWRDNRFTGDDAGFALLDDGRRWKENEGFVPHDTHLWRWQRHLRDQAIARRLHGYREFAAWVSRTYAEVVIEEFDLSRVARVKGPGGEVAEGADLPALARRQRQWAAPSTLRSAIVSACQREGVRVLVVPAANTTRACHQCGAIQDVGADLVHRCAACGTEWDQDDNACVNLLRLAGD